MVNRFMATDLLVFRWEPAPYARDAALCDVEGVGRLLVRRTARGARTFDGFINGKRAIIETKTLDDAKRALEAVAQRKLQS
jgi:hypothetical protein